MKKLSILLISGVMAVACSNGKHAEFEKNTEAAKAYFKLHETENAEEMFTYLSDDLTWHKIWYQKIIIQSSFIYHTTNLT